MNIKLLAIGKTDNHSLKGLIEEYEKRVNFYIKFTLEIIPDLKNSKNISEKLQKEKEGEQILKKLELSDFVVLLDEKGTQFDSIQFSNFLQKRMNSGVKNLVFIIGGAYGFSQEIYQRANQMCSLSKMTFSHQMVRLFFVEQLYRGFTILNNEPYHHQ